MGSVMLEEIELINYRGFDRHKISLRPTSIIVGRNNAGKSTIIEAITLISIVTSRAPRSNFVSPPDWINLPSASKGILPSIRGLDFEFRNICYQYQSSPAVIKAKLTGSKTVTIYISSEFEHIYAVLRKGNRQVTTKGQASSFEDDIINVLPPIGRLRIREQLLSDNYVRANLNTKLASLHFRNQIYYIGNDYYGFSEDIPEDFEEDFVSPTFYESFVRLAEATWPRLRIQSIDYSTAIPPELSLLVRDGAFVAEVGWMGSGLQAWLQTCWFLARCRRETVVVLDEPDIFLHPDLQRKLYRLVEGHYNQVLIATHSTEVLAEVNPEAVLIIDKDANQSKFAENIPAVQSVINHIGGAHNLQFTRLWSARRCLFIEGNDVEILSAFHRLIYPDSPTSLDLIPYIPIHGYGNWKHAVGATIGLKNAGDKSIKAYCILDSDYRTPEEHDKVKKEANQHGLFVHVWKRKEIENYVLSAAAISRVIESRSDNKYPNENDVKKKIRSICDAMKEQVFDNISDAIWGRDRKGIVDANKKARSVVNTAWSSYDEIISICPGKSIVSALSGWSQKNYGVSFSALGLARELRLDELPSEALQVVVSINKSSEFSS